MPTPYFNSFDGVGQPIIAPRALPGTPSTTANFRAEREEAVRRAEASENATLEAFKRAQAAALQSAAAARDAAVALARSQSASTSTSRSTALRTAYVTDIRALYRSWVFNEPTHAVADSIAVRRGQFIVEITEQCGRAFWQLDLLILADVLAAGNTGGTHGPRLSEPLAGARQWAAGHGLRDPVVGRIFGNFDASLRVGGTQTYDAMRALEGVFYTNAQLAAALNALPLTRFNALLACGTAEEATAVS
jgi:hypothetical protein